MKLHVLLVTICTAVTCGTHAASDAALELSSDPLSRYISRRESEDSLWGRFRTEFDYRSTQLFRDRFHPLDTMRRSFAPERYGQFQDRATDLMLGALNRSINYSAREAAVDTPIYYNAELWLKEREEYFGDLFQSVGVFFTDLFKGSVANVEEEEISPSQGIHRDIERSWWDRVQKESKLRYGIRPFRSNGPYAYTSFMVTHDGEPLFLTNLRYYFDHFSDHKFETTFSVPLPYEYRFGFGWTYDTGRDEPSGRVNVRLYKRLFKNFDLHFTTTVTRGASAFIGLSGQF